MKQHGHLKPNHLSLKSSICSDRLGHGRFFFNQEKSTLARGTPTFLFRVETRDWPRNVQETFALCLYFHQNVQPWQKNLAPDRARLHCSACTSVCALSTETQSCHACRRHRSRVWGSKPKQQTDEKLKTSFCLFWGFEIVKRPFCQFLVKTSCFREGWCDARRRYFAKDVNAGQMKDDSVCDSPQ